MLRHIGFMTNRGRIHTKDAKDRTRQRPIEPATIPDELIYPLSMHIGAPAEAQVEIGDQVKRGQLIAKAASHVSANIYASVSGEIVSIEDRPTDKNIGPCIVIRNNKQDETADPLTAPGLDADADAIIECVQAAGIVGMGGAAFPTSVKLNPPPGMTIDTLVINGAECEPYSTSDHRVMLEYSDELIEGIDLISRLYPDLRRVYIVVEDNKADAIKKLRRQISDRSDITVYVLPSLYPTGAEKMLIKELTGREVPSGGLPADVHTILVNVSTVRAVRRAVVLGEPLMDRIVSVSGNAIKEPRNLLVRIGTPVESMIIDCGGLTAAADKILLGGPMMGRPLTDVSVPVTKAITAITVLSPEQTELGTRTACIMCSECLNVCPVNLQPILISEAYERGQIEKARQLGAMDCIECGNCSYICPAKIPLLDNIRKAKAAIKAEEEKG